jgi:pyruvate dehydrogenase E1 component alpha subunit/2-oxoisovalerate dehydrogenase E1 component alpha subunit
MLLRGFPLVPYIAQVFGNSGDLSKGRQMPSHQAGKRVNQVSWSSCIGTQLPQAVGAAWAAKLKGDDTVVMAFLGDGATSSSDFHVAMNFAGVFRAPVVFLCQNNHWSISMPIERQTASGSIAIKASAYGFPGIKVDGNAVEEVYAASAEAIERARRGQGPTLIEAETYRLGAHSSSDDPTRYRDSREVEQWKARDPIEQFKARMIQRKLWSEERDQALRGELLQLVNDAIGEAESKPPPGPETLFDDVYASDPWNLAEQRQEFLASLRRTGPKE